MRYDFLTSTDSPEDGKEGHPYHQHINHFVVVESPLYELDPDHQFVAEGNFDITYH